jgi:trigger factor
MSKKLYIGIIIAIFAAAAALIGYRVCVSGQDRSYDYDLDEYVTVGDYKNLPYYKEEAEVTDEKIDTEIDSRLQAAQKTEEVKEGTVEDGDTINIAFEGKIDGETFEGGSSDSFDLTVGTTQMIDGFVEGLIGKNIGDTVTLDLQFPDDYSNTEVAGKPVTFEVTINSKKVTTTPELADYIKDETDYDNEEDFRESVKSDLLDQKQKQIDDQMKSELWDYVLSQSEVIKYPGKELSAAQSDAESLEDQYQQQAQSYGLSWDDFLSTMFQTDAEGWEAMKYQYAEDQVKSGLVLYSICRKEGIEVSKHEYNKRINELLDENDIDRDTFESQYGKTVEEYADENGWRTQFLLEKLEDQLISWGKEVTKDEYDQIVEERNAAAESTDDESTDSSNAGSTDATDSTGTDASSDSADASSDSSDASSDSSDASSGTDSGSSGGTD